MSNPYFQFKQFRIYQERTSMKVCTDSCILGAWFAPRIPSSANVLDIGCGTGLLMLLLAQVCKGSMHGIELDDGACCDAMENIENSLWYERLQVFSADARSFQYPRKYDFIICNPPFFKDDLKSISESTNMAKHSSALADEDLLSICQSNVNATGTIGLMLPARQAKQFIRLASKYGFYLSAELSVRQSPRHGYFRSMLHFCKTAGVLVNREYLTINTADGQISQAMRLLMKDYYLDAEAINRLISRRIPGDIQTNPLVGHS